MQVSKVVLCTTIKDCRHKICQIKKVKINISLRAYTNHCMTKQASLGTVMSMIMSMMIMMAGWLAGGRSCPALSLVVGGVVVITAGAGVLLLVRVVCVAAQQMFLKNHLIDQYIQL
jgi:hypothetical protein